MLKQAARRYRLFDIDFNSAMNRLSTVLENGAQAASYTYDKNGNRATMTNGNGTTVIYAYNAANLVTSLQNKKGLSTLSNYVYQYYLDGNQAQKTDHTGPSTSYAYDAQRRLTQETESGAADAVTKAYRFDEAGNRLSMTVTGRRATRPITRMTATTVCSPRPEPAAVRSR